MKRNIIVIDEQKCTGCGLCIPNCPEGAIQIISGKARLVSDLMCDGLGACLGHCPEGAITIVEREAEAYDERKVMANIVKQGDDVVEAHLKHLKGHGQTEYFEQALAYLSENKISIPAAFTTAPKADLQHGGFSGCPGSRSMSFKKEESNKVAIETGARESKLTHWPIQLHLMSPMAPQYQNADVLLSADCVSYALADFHKDFLADRKLAIACPKLDDNQEVYVEKITALIDEANIASLTVLIMEVPCCGGLLRIAQKGLDAAKRKIPINYSVVGINGTIVRSGKA